MSSQTIPCVVLGKHRQIAEPIAVQLGKHNYAVNAVLDEVNYSPENLGVVLRTLRRRPQVLIVGEGFTDKEVEDGISVWEKYVEDVGVADTALARVPVGSLQKIGPEGIISWFIEELDKTYKK